MVEVRGDGPMRKRLRHGSLSDFHLYQASSIGEIRVEDIWALFCEVRGEEVRKFVAQDPMASISRSCWVFGKSNEVKLI